MRSALISCIFGLIAGGCTFDKRGRDFDQPDGGHDIGISELGADSQRETGTDSLADQNTAGDGGGEGTNIPPPPLVKSKDGWLLRAPLLDNPHHKIFAAWGSAADDVWMVGEAGVILRFDGRVWSRVSYKSTGARLNAISGSAADDIWIVGDAGTVLHYNGKTVAVVKAPTTEQLNGVFASGKRGELWIVGNGGVLIQRQKGNFRVASGGTQKTLRAIAGLGENDITVVGDNGTILHFDGNIWSVEPSPVTYTLRAVVPLKSGDFWAVGDLGSVITRDAKGIWSKLTPKPSTSAQLHAVWGQSNKEIWIGGFNVLHVFDGAKWTSRTPTGLPTINGIWGLGSGKRWVVADDGKLFCIESGAPQSVELSLPQLHAVAGPPFFFAGAQGRLFAERFGAFVSIKTRTVATIRSLWVRANDDLWLGADVGQTWHFKATTWTSAATPGSDVRAFWGFSATDIWAAGTGGRVARRSGATWKRLDISTGVTITSIFGVAPNEVWATGGNGLLRRYDGATWQVPLLKKATSATLAGGWAFSTNEAWAGGDGGIMLRYDGAQWSEVASGTRENLHGLWARDNKTIWAVGEKGVIVFFDGSSWRAKASGTTETLRSVWGDQRRVIAVGDQGIVIEKR